MSENIFNTPILTNGVMTSTLTSTAMDLSRIDGYAIYAKWTGTPVGDIKLQASVDGTNYIDYPGSDIAITAAGDAIWEVTTAYYDKIRVVYTFTSGTGTLNVQINGKGDLLA